MYVLCQYIGLVGCHEGGERVIVNGRLRRCLYLVVFYDAGLVADLAVKGAVFCLLQCMMLPHCDTVVDFKVVL